jgi:hypothetical protein
VQSGAKVLDASVGGCSDFVREVAAGGLAGVLSWASIYPVDVMKSRIQAYGGSWMEVFQDMKREGAHVFVRGMPATLLRAFAVNGAIFYGVGTTRRALQRS